MNSIVLMKMKKFLINPLESEQVGCSVDQTVEDLIIHSRVSYLKENGYSRIVFIGAVF